MKLKFDMHVHTAASADSRMTLERAAAAARRRGLDGIAVCDHNVCYTGKHEADGLIVIPGVEYSTECGHLLGLFLERAAECECAFDGSGRARFADAARAIRSAGGICVLAHPYQKIRIPPETIDDNIDLHRGELDGIEIFNSRAAYRRENANLLAGEKSAAAKLNFTAGSDAHSAAEVGNAYLEVETESAELSDIRRAILEGRARAAGRDSSPVKIAESQFVKCFRTKKYLKLPKTAAFYLACVFWKLRRKLK